MQKLRKFFKDDESVNVVTKPVEYPYFKYIRFHLLLLNSWPGEELGEKKSKYRILMNIAFILLEMFYIFNISIYLKNNIAKLDFYDLGETYLRFFTRILALSRMFMISLSQKSKDLITKLLTKMHLFYYKDLSEHSMNVHKEIHFISHIYTLVLLTQSWLMVIFFNIIPMYNNYSLGKYNLKHLQNSSFEQSVYLQLPFDTTNNIIGYLFACLLNWVESFLVTDLILLIDLVLSLIIFHLWGHFRILIEKLDSFPLPAKKEIIMYNNKKIYTEMYSDDELEEVSKKLKECIDYHRLLINFTNEISDAFGAVLFIYFIFFQTCGCIQLLECSQMESQALLFYGSVSITFFQQLIQLSVIFELIGSKSGQLKDAVYGLPWECMDVKNRKTVLIFLINVQKPIHVKALGLISVGVQTMATIIKASFSYFTFIRSL